MKLEISKIKQAAILLMLFSLFINNAIGQVDAAEFSPMKSPDVTAFLQANYLPVNESTGRANVTVPIYNIDLDGLSIPISLSYNTSGVKVDGIASKVGLNWTLNAGGFINKEIRGQNDMHVNGDFNDISQTGTVYVGYGYLRHLLTWSGDPNHPIAEPFRDTQPDMYYAMAPGINTSFTHKSDGSPFEISPTGTIIESPFNDPAYLHNMYYRNSLKPGFKFRLTSPNGYIYTFKDREFNVSRVYEPDNVPLGELVTDPWALDISDTALESELYTNGSGDVSSIFYADNGHSADLFPTTHLTSIQNPVTKRSIKFIYAINNIVDNNRHVENRRSLTGTTIRQLNFEHDFSREKVLSKIVFPGGIVNFYYEDDRSDVRGGITLKKIEVRNNEGELIKAAVLEHSYFQAIENCTDFHCYRLKLDAVKYIDKDNIVLPGYEFAYNGVSLLPKRYSLAQDFTGYCNANANNVSGLFPRIYYNANQGKNSYIPFQFPLAPYASVGNGTINKIPNPTYAEAGSLYSITNPTGGLTVFDYELNSFQFLGATVAGGGLRVKSQTLYNSATSTIPEKEIEYEYLLANGQTSGSITNLPQFVKQKNFVFSNTREITQSVNNKLGLSKGSYVTYSRVKKYETNNGYIINEYTNGIDEPNSYPTTISGSPSSVFDQAFSDGLFPNVYTDLSRNRGKLLKSSVFDEQNVLVKETTNQYQSVDYDSPLVFQEVVVLTQPNWQFSMGNTAATATMQTSHTSGSYLLQNSSTEEYSSAGTITNEKSFTYDSNLPFIKEVENLIDNSETRRAVNYYPFDSEVASPEMSQLTALNILSPVKKENYKNTDLLSSAETKYSDFGLNKILPSGQEISKGSNTAERIVSFDQYDKRGNLIQFTKEDGMTISILWAYNYQNKVAEILNATYSEVLSALNVTDVDYLQNMPNSLLETELNNLRSNLTKAQIHTYLHKPGVGPISITDPKGLKENYEYDNFKRLIRVRDHNNNIISENEYNYALSPTATLPTQQALAVYINRNNTPDYQASKSPTIQYTLLTAMTSGGRGDYTYEWTESGSTTIIGTSSKYTAEVPCDNNKTYDLRVTDSDGTVVTETVTVNAPVCGEPFYVGPIQGYSGTNNQNNFWVNAEGGSYSGIFSYRWFTPSGAARSSYGNGLTNANDDGILRNNSGNVVNVDLSVRVTDIETGCTVTVTRNVAIQPEFEINSCFVSGTTITMSDGSLKNIENIVVGDAIMSFNTTTNRTETATVEEIVTPLHTQLVVFTYSNGMQNTNTPDHPYFIKNKGWSSYNPVETEVKYRLQVDEIKGGDIVLVYNPATGLMEETSILSSTIISEEQQTYNLSKLSNNNNFFANGVLAHNKSGE